MVAKHLTLPIANVPVCRYELHGIKHGIACNRRGESFIADIF